MRRTAADMENTLNLLPFEESNSVYKKRRKCLGISCLIILTHGVIFSIGYFTGYNNCDGSNIFL